MGRVCLKSQGYPRPEESGVLLTRNKSGVWAIEKNRCREGQPRESIVSATQVYAEQNKHTNSKSTMICVI